MQVFRSCPSRACEPQVLALPAGDATDDAKGLLGEGQGRCDMLPALEHGPGSLPSAPSTPGPTSRTWFVSLLFSLLFNRTMKRCENSWFGFIRSEPGIVV
jgi:hypothetical protein